MRPYIVLHNATNRSSNMGGKEIGGFFEDGFQLAKSLNNFKSFKCNSKINKYKGN